MKKVANKKLKTARLEKNLSGSEVAKRIGCPDPKTYYRWERGENTPSSDYRDKLCELFEMTTDELGLNRAAHTTKFPNIPANLPMGLPELIGRDEAIAEICKLLRNPDVRLLTLTGAPGIGKTSLARHVIQELQQDTSVFADGVFFVELMKTSKQDKDKVVTAIALKLGLKDPGVSSLLEHFNNKRLLLILDNCEHLIEQCRKLAETLLPSCEKLQILAASTELLHIKGEVFRRVRLLPYPDPKYLPPTESIEKYDAVRLFVTWRQKIKPEFTITDKSKYAVAQICSRLEGHPHAIRLAAGINTLSLQQIVEKMDNCLPFLVGGSRSDAEWHETMRKTIKLRYDLLSKPEKLLLQRLSVFKGGWTYEAAEAVCAGNGLKKDSIFGMIEDLARKSLVEVEDRGETRCRLLETIRQYAEEILCETAKAEEIYKRHLSFFSHGYKLTLPGLTAEGVGMVMTLLPEHENLQAALRWCLKRQHYDILLAFIAWLWEYWYEYEGYYGRAEAHYWLTMALKVANEMESSPEYAEVLWGAAVTAFEVADEEDDLPQELYSDSGVLLAKLDALENSTHARTQTLLKQALQLYEKQDNKERIVDCNLYLGELDDNDDNKLVYYKKSLTLSQSLAYTRGIAESLYWLGRIMLHNPVTYKEGAAYLKASLEPFFRLGDTDGIFECLYSLSGVAYAEGSLEQAAILMASAIALRDSVFELKEDIVGIVNGDGIIGVDMDKMRKELGEQMLTEFVKKGYTMTLQEAVAYACTTLQLTD